MGHAPPAPALCQSLRKVELLVDALYDSDAKVQKGAIQSYLHWLAAPSRLSDVVIQDWLWHTAMLSGRHVDMLSAVFGYVWGLPFSGSKTLRSWMIP